jgi:hypothetical protein
MLHYKLEDSLNTVLEITTMCTGTTENHANCLSDQETSSAMAISQILLKFLTVHGYLSPSILAPTRSTYQSRQTTTGVRKT